MFLRETAVTVGDKLVAGGAVEADKAFYNEVVQSFCILERAAVMDTQDLRASAYSHDKRLGSILVELDLVTKTDVQMALRTQRELSFRNSQVPKLGHILLYAKRIKMEDLHAALRKQSQKAEAIRRKSEESMRTKKELEEIYGQASKIKKAKESQSESFWQRLSKIKIGG